MEIFVSVAGENGLENRNCMWVNIWDFSDEEELLEYITTKLGSETFDILDTSDIPNVLCDDYGSPSFYEDLFKFKRVLEDHGIDGFDIDSPDIIELWNDYQSDISGDDYIYYLEDIEHYLPPDPMDAFNMGIYSDIVWSDDFFIFDGYGNIQSIRSLDKVVIEDELVTWIIENL